MSLRPVNPILLGLLSVGLVNAGAVAAFLLFLRGGPDAVAYAFTLAVLGWSLSRGYKQSGGTFAGARAVLVAGLAVEYSRGVGAADAALLLTTLLLMGLTLHEKTVRRLTS